MLLAGLLGRRLIVFSSVFFTSFVPLFNFRHTQDSKPTASRTGSLVPTNNLSAIYSVAPGVLLLIVYSANS